MAKMANGKRLRVNSEIAALLLEALSNESFRFKKAKGKVALTIDK